MNEETTTTSVSESAKPTERVVHVKEPRAKNEYWKIALGVLVIFLIGIFVGSGVTMAGFEKGKDEQRITRSDQRMPYDQRYMPPQNCHWGDLGYGWRCYYPAPYGYPTYPYPYYDYGYGRSEPMPMPMPDPYYNQGQGMDGQVSPAEPRTDDPAPSIEPGSSIPGGPVGEGEATTAP